MYAYFSQNIRAPLLFFPIVFAAVSDALVALKRIQKLLVAEELAEPYTVDTNSKHAVHMDGDFTWEVSEPPSEQGKSKKSKPELPTTVKDEKPLTKDEKPFSLTDLQITVPKGAFVAIVGKVGSGKSSLLQAMIGEMRRTRGEVGYH